MGLFQKDLGTPDGYGEWLIGDESQYRLAQYHFGEDVVLDDYELDVLVQITKPDSETIFRPESCGHTGRTALALYVPIDQMDNRWGDRQTHDYFHDYFRTNEIGI